jgi:hypothetical protein
MRLLPSDMPVQCQASGHCSILLLKVCVRVECTHADLGIHPLTTGGEYEEVGGNLRLHRSSNAYMLVYVRHDEWDKVMCAVGKNDLQVCIAGRVDQGHPTWQHWCRLASCPCGNDVPPQLGKSLVTLCIAVWVLGKRHSAVAGVVPVRGHVML